MPGSIHCHYKSCRKKFKPKRNQRYHSARCARLARRVRDRLRKRRKRLQAYEDRIKEQVERQKEGGEKAGPDDANPDGSRVDSPPVRSLEKKRKFSYRCDRCHVRVLRPARQLNVYCCARCRRAYRNKVRCLRRQEIARRKGKRSAKSSSKQPNSWEKISGVLPHGPPLLG